MGRQEKTEGAEATKHEIHEAEPKARQREPEHGQGRQQELQSQAGMFRTKAKKLRSQMWWKKCKIQLLIAVIALTILGVIVVVILAYTGQFDEKKEKS